MVEITDTTGMNQETLEAGREVIRGIIDEFFTADEKRRFNRKGVKIRIQKLPPDIAGQNIGRDVLLDPDTVNRADGITEDVVVHEMIHAQNRFLEEKNPKVYLRKESINDSQADIRSDTEIEEAITEAMTTARLHRFDSTSGKEVPKQRGSVKRRYNSFKPHMMYNPKTGEGVYAEKEEDHLRMKGMGWVHQKPKRYNRSKGLTVPVVGDNSGFSTEDLIQAMQPQGLDHGFMFEGVFITDPSSDESNRFPVNPVEYYGQAYLDWLDVQEKRFLTNPPDPSKVDPEYGEPMDGVLPGRVAILSLTEQSADGFTTQEVDGFYSSPERTKRVEELKEYFAKQMERGNNVPFAIDTRWLNTFPEEQEIILTDGTVADNLTESFMDIWRQWPYYMEVAGVAKVKTKSKGNRVFYEAYSIDDDGEVIRDPLFDSEYDLVGSDFDDLMAGRVIGMDETKPTNLLNRKLSDSEIAQEIGRFRKANDKDAEYRASVKASEEAWESEWELWSRYKDEHNNSTLPEDVSILDWKRNLEKGGKKVSMKEAVKDRDLTSNAVFEEWLEKNGLDKRRTPYIWQKSFMGQGDRLRTLSAQPQDFTRLKIYERRIDGKRFIGTNNAYTKENARRFANVLRSRGGRARVIPSSGGYRVFARR